MEESKIQWTNATVNFWHGCIKVSDGCKFCYMYRDKDRYGQDPTTVLRTSNKTFRAALEWKEAKKIFTCSWSDYFIAEADQWRKDAWSIIKSTPQHSWQILTKRPERIEQHLPSDWGDGYENVWLGVSVENQKYVDRILELQKLKSEKSKFLSFISVEPLIDKVDFTSNDAVLSAFKQLNWVIIGGESGYDFGKYRYRQCQLGWIEEIISLCKKYGIPVFVKQLGTYLAKQMNMKDKHGGDMNEWPEQFRIREFPVQQRAISPINNNEQLKGMFNF